MVKLHIWKFKETKLPEISYILASQKKKKAVVILEKKSYSLFLRYANNFFD